MLSGPVERLHMGDSSVNFISTHSLRIDTFTEQESLDQGLQRFWKLESIGIMENETSVYDNFTQQISYKGGRYKVHLPWRKSHPPLPDNYELCQRRLFRLLKRLNQNPDQLLEYDSVIKEQLHNGIVEVVSRSGVNSLDCSRMKWDCGDVVAG